MRVFRVVYTDGNTEDVKADSFGCDGVGNVLFFKVKQGLATAQNPEGKPSQAILMMVSNWSKIIDLSEMESAQESSLVKSS